MVTTSEVRVEAQFEELADKRPFWSVAGEFARKQPLGTFGMVIVVVMIFASAFATILTPYDPEANAFEHMLTPPHGPLGDKADLVSYREVLAAVHAKVSELVVQGKTADEVVKAKPTAPWDEKWGQGFMKPERWLRIVYGSVVAEGRSERR